ncbi:MAG: helix-turn-helix domain-containing protein [Actinomycetota bacterium]
MPSLRERNRRNAMRTTQRAALELFEARGFAAVTVAEIAEEAGMAASTIYRHFETKEAIVLWDEHDADLEAAFVREFSRQKPLAALRAVFTSELSDRYDQDLEFQLRRVRYIYATEEVHVAAGEMDYRDAAEITTALQLVLSPEHRHAAPIMAGAAMSALDAAFDRWQQGGGATPLGTLIGEAFDALANLDGLA